VQVPDALPWEHVQKITRAVQNQVVSSEMAVSRIRGINPSRLTRWNEPDSDGLCHDGALVSNDVHVLATVINKRHPR
jgi:hypothetical protein